MADLTPEEQAQVKLWLGYGRRNTDLDDHVVGLSDAEISQVRSLLEDLSALDAKMTGSVQTAGVYTRAEEISFRGAEGQSMLANQGMALVRRLARFLGVPVLRTPFAAGVTTGSLMRG